MLKVLHPLHGADRRRLISNHGLPKRHGKLEGSLLPGYDATRRAAIIKLYEGLSPSERRKLRAQRAQRALDVIDLFHADLPIVIGSMTEQQRRAMLEVALLTNKIRHKLRGIAADESSELATSHEWCKEYG